MARHKLVRRGYRADNRRSQREQRAPGGLVPVRRIILTCALVLLLSSAPWYGHGAEPGAGSDSGLFSSISINWRDLNELATIIISTGAMVLGVLWLWIKYKFSSEFAAKSDVRELNDRLQMLEHDIKRLPDADDINRISDRVSKVEKGVAVAVEQTRGLKDLTSRIDHSVKLLMEHHIVKQPVYIERRGDKP